MPTEEERNQPCQETGPVSPAQLALEEKMADARAKLEAAMTVRKSPITPELLDNWFTYHRPTDEQAIRYGLIRDAARKFAQVLLDNTPPGADQTATFRELRGVVMSANQSIACNGK